MDFLWHWFAATRRCPEASISRDVRFCLKERDAAALRFQMCWIAVADGNVYLGYEAHLVLQPHIPGRGSGHASVLLFESDIQVHFDVQLSVWHEVLVLGGEVANSDELSKTPVIFIGCKFMLALCMSSASKPVRPGCIIH